MKRVNFEEILWLIFIRRGMWYMNLSISRIISILWVKMEKYLFVFFRDFWKYQSIFRQFSPKNNSFPMIHTRRGLKLCIYIIHLKDLNPSKLKFQITAHSLKISLKNSVWQPIRAKCSHLQEAPILEFCSSNLRSYEAKTHRGTMPPSSPKSALGLWPKSPN